MRELAHSAFRTVLEHVTLPDLVGGQLPDEVESLAAQPDAWVAR